MLVLASAKVLVAMMEARGTAARTERAPTRAASILAGSSDGDCLGVVKSCVATQGSDAE